MMRWLDLGRAALVAAAAIALNGCITKSPHENFMSLMSHEVGRSTSDRDSYRNKVPDWLIASRILPNGNVEEAYHAGRRWRCPVFFEIDRTAGRIIGWRYEGEERDCVILP